MRLFWDCMTVTCDGFIGYDAFLSRSYNFQTDIFLRSKCIQPIRGSGPLLRENYCKWLALNQLLCNYALNEELY